MEQGISGPGHEDVARYLVACLEMRGPNSVAVHLAAIANLFRSQGRYLDAKSETIQHVMEPIRKAIKAKASHDLRK
jgi:hypothetical protein